MYVERTTLLRSANLKKNRSKTNFFFENLTGGPLPHRGYPNLKKCYGGWIGGLDIYSTV